MRTGLPTGTVTFLFADIVGSTRLLHELRPDAYASELAEHRRTAEGRLRDARGVDLTQTVP
jgi:class 3 adenylate cyclase